MNIGTKRWRRALRARCLCLALGAVSLAATLAPLESAHGQQRGALRGTVVDSATGRPIARAVVTVEGSMRQATTSDIGAFVIPGLALGRQVIRVRAIGYRPATTEASVTTGEDVLPPIAVAAIPASMDPAVVSAFSRNETMRRAATPVAIVDFTQIAGRATDLNTVIGRVAGVQIRQAGGLGSASIISVRGLEGKRIEIFINGRPLNTPDGSFGINDIPIQIIDRIEVYKGIVPAWLGAQGLGGAVNVVTKRALEEYTDFAATVQSFGTRSLYGILKRPVWGSATGPQLWLAGGGFLTTAENDYRMASPYQPGLLIRRDHDGYLVGVGAVKLELRRVWFDELALEALVVQNNKELQGVQQNIRFAETRSRILLGQVEAERNGFGPGGRLRFTYTFQAPSIRSSLIDTSHFRFDFAGNRTPSPSIQGELGYIPRYSDDWQRELRQQVNVGLRLSEAQSLNLNVQSRYAALRPQDTLATRVAGLDVTPGDGNLLSHVVGVTHEFSPPRRPFANTFGVKVTTYRSDGTPSSLYGVSTGVRPEPVRRALTAIGVNDAIKVDLSPAVMVKASWDNAVRSPNAAELFGDGFLVVPSTALRPERSLNLTAGLLADKPVGRLERVQLEWNVFAMRLHDMIKLASNGLTSAYVNVGDVRVLGTDAELKVDVTPSLYLHVNGTWQDLRDVRRLAEGSSAANPTRGLRIPNVPWLYGNAGVEWHREARGRGNSTRVYWDISGTASYFYDFEVSRNQDRSIPASLIHDAGIERAIRGGRLTVGAEVRNAFDSRVLNVFNSPLPGRAFRLKVRFSGLDLLE